MRVAVLAAAAALAPAVVLAGEPERRLATAFVAGCVALAPDLDRISAAVEAAGWTQTYRAVNDDVHLRVWLGSSDGDRRLSRTLTAEMVDSTGQGFCRLELGRSVDVAALVDHLVEAAPPAAELSRFSSMKMDLAHFAWDADVGGAPVRVVVTRTPESTDVVATYQRTDR